MKKRSTVLIVDDDRFEVLRLIEILEAKGYSTAKANNADDALILVEKLSDRLKLAVLDIMMPVDNSSKFTVEEAKGGWETGKVLFQRIRKFLPNLPVLVLTASPDQGLREYFIKQPKTAFLYKPYHFQNLNEAISNLESGRRMRCKSKPNMFIVHGHDETAKYSLKNFLQNNLKLGEPVILHEQPSFGKTIIEKFEEHTRGVDLVFVLLTPDDEVKSEDTEDSQKRRARQNVIFELGFFLGLLKRTSGKVFFLYKGKLDLPSDISGIIYIDISGGIETAGEQIRKEIRQWLE